MLHSLAEHLEVTIQAGGSAEEESYRSAVTLEKIIFGATADSTGLRMENEPAAGTDSGQPSTIIINNHWLLA